MSYLGIITVAGLVLVGTMVVTGSTISEKSEVISAYIESKDITPTPTNTPTPTHIPTPSPTATPSPTPIAYTSSQLEEWFTRYSNEYGADRELLRRIAACESGFNAPSYNSKHDYAGMYQFSAGTWTSTRVLMSADPNIDLRFNPEESIKTAAFKISRGGADAWPDCSK